MTDVTVTKGNVSALSDDDTIRLPAGETLTAGQVVYLNGANGAKRAAAGAAATAKVIGVIVAPKDAVVGDVLDVGVQGCLVGGFSGLTPGDLLYLSDTAGVLSTTAGTKVKSVARVITTTDILITLEDTDPA